MKTSTHSLPRAAGEVAQSSSYGPQFNATREESELINKIANRAVKAAADLGVRYDKMTAFMDIEACHCTGCPLDLARLLAADDGNFGHDVFGIRRYIDRTTGKLTNHFLPRTANTKLQKAV